MTKPITEFGFAGEINNMPEYKKEMCFFFFCTNLSVITRSWIFKHQKFAKCACMYT